MKNIRLSESSGGLYTSASHDKQMTPAGFSSLAVFEPKNSLKFIFGPTRSSEAKLHPGWRSYKHPPQHHPQPAFNYLEVLGRLSLFFLVSEIPKQVGVLEERHLQAAQGGDPTRTTEAESRRRIVIFSGTLIKTRLQI